MGDRLVPHHLSNIKILISRFVSTSGRGCVSVCLTIYNDLSFGACCFFFFMHIWLDTQQGQVALETKVMVNAQVGVEVQEGVYCLDINLQ